MSWGATFFVFFPQDFTLSKLPIVMGILRADERCVCMLVGDTAKAILDNMGTTHNQSRDGELYALFNRITPTFTLS